jgi:hypothetical protein
MLSRGLFSLAPLALCLGIAPRLTASEIPVEALPEDARQAKIVLIAGSNYYKPGEHDYIAGCSVLYELLKQTPAVAPVLAIDWPKKPATLAGAKAVVLLFDGAAKSQLLKEDHLAQIQKLADAGAGIVHLHQVVDYPKELGDRARALTGAAFENGFSQRAHWVGEFKEFPNHPIFQGVAPFKINDGWLFKLRFVPELKGVTPLLRTVAPKSAIDPAGDDAIVGWAYERMDGGRSFAFTGCHLHSSFAQEGYRRFLVNGILWTAKAKIPAEGAPVKLSEQDMNKYLQKEPAPKGK